MYSHHEEGKFEKFVHSILVDKSKKTMVIGITLFLLAAAIMMFPMKIVLAKMLPGKSTNTFTVYLDTPSKSSIDETKKVATCITNILQKEKEVTDIETFLGEGSPLDYAGLVKGSGMKKGEQYAEIVVNLTDKSERSEKSFSMTQRLRPILNKECGKLVNNTSIKLVEMPAGPPTLADIVVEVYGQDNRKVIALSNEVKNILQKTDGLVDVDVMADENYKTYQIIPIKEKISRSGLTVEHINKILYLSFKGMGIAVKDTIEANHQIPVFLSLDEPSKTISTNDIESLNTKLSSVNLMNSTGMMVPLMEVVELKATDSIQTIYHKDLKTMTNVVATTDMVSQVYPLLDARTQMIDYFSKKYEVSKVDGISTFMFDLQLKDKITGEQYLLRWDGEMKVTLDTFRDLGAAFIAALVLIFLHQKHSS